MLKLMTEAHCCKIEFSSQNIKTPCAETKGENNDSCYGGSQDDFSIISCEEVTSLPGDADDSDNNFDIEQNTYVELQEPQPRIDEQMTQAQTSSSSDQDLKDFTLEKLHEHLNEECPKNRTCMDCEKTFNSKEQFHAHLKFLCGSVKINCATCDKSMTRKQYFLHDCFVTESLVNLDLNQQKQFEASNQMDCMKNKYETEIDKLKN